MANHPKHLLCIDFETSIFHLDINKKNLSDKELLQLDNGYALDSLNKTLKILKKHNQKATFFVVLKLEKLYPGFLKSIKQEGHEIGWHGWEHNNLDDIKTLKYELEMSKKYIKKFDIKGFQAPRIIFSKKGYKLLKKYDFLYSSSIYGNSNKIYIINGIYEIPVSVMKQNYNPSLKEISFPSHMNLKNLKQFGFPIGSSFFWSILRSRYYVRKFSRAQQNFEIMNIFIHNWQLFPDPRIEEEPRIKRLMREPFFAPYMLNVLPIFESLLSQFGFQPIITYIYEKKNLLYTR